MKKINIPECKKENVEIKKFEVTLKQAKLFNIQNIFGHCFDRDIEPGAYTKLIIDRKLIMSDTPAELDDHRRFVYEAFGNILINGLGLGVVVLNLLEKAHFVDSITVNEINKNVIDLVSPYYKNPKVFINNADAFIWKPPKGMKYDSIWHDIWTNICSDNLTEMKKLHRRYGRWLAPNGFQMSWGREQIKN